MSTGRPMFERLVHDLKGPLSPLQTAAYLLRRPELPEEKRIELAETIERQARRMAGMIEELGDWVRGREGRLIHRARPFELGLAIDLAIGAVPGCTADPVLGPGIERAQVDGDDARFVQALATLLGYAQWRGGVTLLTAHAVDGMAVLQITDAGPPVDMPERLFLDPLPEPYDLGLGLGLIVAEAIVRAHGGSLVARRGHPGLVLELVVPVAPPA